MTPRSTAGHSDCDPRFSWTSVLAEVQWSEFPEWPRVWSQCRRRLRRWSVPPNWSAEQWFDEIQALGLASACQAIRDYDPLRGVPLAAFVRQRVLAAGLTRYRQEWSYASHCSVHSNSGGEESWSEEVDEVGHDGEAVKLGLTKLREPERQLIVHLFWNGWTETALAQQLGISQSAVSKRKRAALLKLRCRIQSVQ